MRIFLCLVLMLGAPVVSAHEVNGTLKIKRMTSSKTYVKVLVENTHAGGLIRCAFYDENNDIVAVDSTPSEEFATEMLVRHEDLFDPAEIKSYRCIHHEYY